MRAHWRGSSMHESKGTMFIDRRRAVWWMVHRTLGSCAMSYMSRHVWERGEGGAAMSCSKGMKSRPHSSHRPQASGLS